MEAIEITITVKDLLKDGFENREQAEKWLTKNSEHITDKIFGYVDEMLTIMLAQDNLLDADCSGDTFE